MTKRPIVHIEIPSQNKAAAGKFYHALFGWEVQVMEQFDYHGFETGNGGGALVDLGEMFKAGEVIVYIGSDDIDADITKIKELGGKVSMDKVEVPGMGHFVHFQDPTGNRLALWQSSRNLP